MDYINCPLRNFYCSDYVEPIEIKYGDKVIFYLLYNDNELLKIPQTYMYAEKFGIDNIMYIGDHFICYKTNEISMNDFIKRKVIINNLYVECQLFSDALWFIKDNSVTPGLAIISSDEPIEPQSLRRNGYYSNAIGNYDIVQFTKEDIYKAMEWYQVLDKLSLKLPSERVNIDNSLTNMSNYLKFDIPSFNRAYYYLDIARKTDFIPAKIALYISVLETLFAVKGDNTHKTAERTAALLGNSDEERIQLYDDITTIYDIRSKYVHGSEIKDKKKQMTLPDISIKADEIVRRVLIEMFQKHNMLNYKNGKDKPEYISMDADDVDKWFNDLVLRRD